MTSTTPARSRLPLSRVEATAARVSLRSSSVRSASVGHRLVAMVAEGAPPAVALERQDKLVLPRLSGETTVRLLPDAGSKLFPSQSVLTVLVGPDGADPDADHVQISADVSGLPVADLFVLRPGTGSITVTALGRRKDTTLPPHAELARDVTRELLGVAFVPAAEAVDLVVGVDCTAPMRASVESGELEAVLEILAGVASVLDPDGDVDAVLCAREAKLLRPESIGEFARTTMAEVSQRPLVTGLRSQALDSSRPDTLTYLVTDAIQADLAERERPLQLVLLGGGDVTARAGERDGQTTIPRTPPAAAGQLRWERHEVRPIVQSLLAGYRDSRNARPGPGAAGGLR